MTGVVMETERFFTRPLLDRFLEPQREGDRVDLDRYLDILSRDVEILCNTRSGRGPAEESSADAGVVTEYGLPDWTGLSPARDVGVIAGALRQALRAFEPRLCEVTVRPLEDGDAAELGDAVLEKTLGARLRVDARISADRDVRVIFSLHVSEEGITAGELVYGH